MGNSLQDQLLQAGLVSEDQLRSAREAPNRKARGRKPRKRGKPNSGANAGRANSGKQGAARNDTPSAQPATPPLEVLNAKIRSLLDEHRQNEDGADVPYNFTRESRIKKLYVSEPQRTALLAGELAIVGYRRVHHIVPASVALEITDMRSEIFVHQVGRDDLQTEAVAEAVNPDSSAAAEADSAPSVDKESASSPESDLMAEHPIPDDLTW